MKFERLLEALPEQTSSTDEELIRRAYESAKKAHKGQKRASGEPYINHCLAVAIIMAELGAPTPTIVAALLHDTVEDTDLTLEDLDRDVRSEVAQLVDGPLQSPHAVADRRGVSGELLTEPDVDGVLQMCATDFDHVIERAGLGGQCVGQFR